MVSPEVWEWIQAARRSPAGVVSKQSFVENLLEKAMARDHAQVQPRPEEP